MLESWFILSLLVGIMIGIATIINTFLINNNVNPVVVIVYKFTIAFFLSCLYFIYLVKNKKVKISDLYSMDKKYLMLIIFGGFLSTCLILTSLKALKNIPNGGYSVAIKSSTALIVSFILSILLLKKTKNNHFNPLTIIGLIMMLIGGALVKLNSRK